MTTSPANDPVNQTLRPLLQKQLARLRSRYFLFGIAKAALWVAALVVLFFVLDRWLRLPAPIRLLHTAATVAIGVYGVMRFVRYPLSRQFSELDLAMWLEHTYPELHQRLVSAVQLHGTGQQDDAGQLDETGRPALRNQSRAMIDQLWRETADATRNLQLDELFDNRGLSRQLAGAILLITGLAIGAVMAPQTARTFVLRHLGMQVDYPRATTLVVELPPAGPDLQRTDSDGLSELVLPAGADLHVSVHALGVVPKEAQLVLQALREDGSTGASRTIGMTPRPNDRFRHVFRRLSGSFEFRASGGDDEYGDRRVIVRTVRPAQVANLQASIQPPAYTGVQQIEQAGGAIEALAGSQVELTVRATAPVREATMVFLESGQRIELQPIEVQDDGGQALAFGGAFTLSGSDRYQIELVAENGLRNPNPGTYPISALQDYAPVGRWLLPEDDTLTLLPSGLLCLRLDARDDFGLESLTLRIERGGSEIYATELLAKSPDETTPREPITSALPTTILALPELLGDNPTNEGLFATVTLRDNKAPEPGTAELPRRIVQIVDPPQLASQIAKAFRRLREEVTQANDIQIDRQARLNDLLARAADGAEPASNAETAQILTGVEVGQGRIASSISRVHRGLMRAFDLHLWNRLEPSQHADTVVDLYREHSAGLTAAIALDAAFYRDLTARRAAGTLGAMETTLDPILSMIAMTDELAENTVPEVTKLLSQAQVARDNDRGPLLVDVQQRQQQIQSTLAQLLLRLEEWNDYQDLVQEVRALRDRQRDLQSRTQEVRGK